MDLIGATTSDVTDVNKPVRFGTARAVSFANADQPNPAWLAGDHYLAVTLARNIGDNTDEKTLSVPVRYQIAFAPVGVAVAGPIFPDFKLPEESVSTSTTSASSAPSNAAANADVSSTSATATPCYRRCGCGDCCPSSRSIGRDNGDSAASVSELA